MVTESVERLSPSRGEFDPEQLPEMRETARGIFETLQEYARAIREGNVVEVDEEQDDAITINDLSSAVHLAEFYAHRLAELGEQMKQTEQYDSNHELSPFIANTPFGAIVGDRDLWRQIKDGRFGNPPPTGVRANPEDREHLTSHLKYVMRGILDMPKTFAQYDQLIASLNEMDKAGKNN